METKERLGGELFYGIDRKDLPSNVRLLTIILSVAGVILSVIASLLLRGEEHKRIWPAIFLWRQIWFSVFSSIKICLTTEVLSELGAYATR